MRVRVLALSVAIVLMPGFTLAQGVKHAAKEPAAQHAVVTPDQLVWKPLILAWSRPSSPATRTRRAAST